MRRNGTEALFDIQAELALKRRRLRPRQAAKLEGHPCLEDHQRAWLLPESASRHQGRSCYPQRRWLADALERTCRCSVAVRPGKPDTRLGRSPMFTGRVIMVTGAAGNVGSVLAALLASRGARIAAVDTAN